MNSVSSKSNMNNLIITRKYKLLKIEKLILKMKKMIRIIFISKITI